MRNLAILEREYTCYIEGVYFREWYVGGKLHRIGAPALVTNDGGEIWYQNGLKHRIGAPAEITSCGDKHWYFRGKQHNISGAATIRPGMCFYALVGRRVHRESHILICTY